MGKDGEHQHFFDFESVDREWHKLRHTWDERQEERNRREQHEKEVFETKYKAIKPNKDNKDGTIKSNKNKSKPDSMAKSYNASYYSGSPRRLKIFSRNTLVCYQNTVWKVIANNKNTGKHDLVYVHASSLPF
jgi:hypothetical protein